MQVALANANTQAQAAEACLQWGLVLVSKRAYQEAIRQLFEALLLAGQTGERKIQSYALVNLGKIAICQGDYQTAISHYQRALKICREIGDKQMEGEVVALALIGWTHNNQAHWSDALTYFDLGQEIATEIGDQELEFYCLAGMGRSLTGLGRPEEGALLLREAVDGFYDLQMDAYALESLAGWVRAQLVLGNTAEAQPALEDLRMYLENIGPFDGADAPLLMLWTLYEGLAANQDARAQEI